MSSPYGHGIYAGGGSAGADSVRDWFTPDERVSIFPSSGGQHDGPLASTLSVATTATVVPEVGKIDLSLDELCKYINAHKSLRTAQIVATECYTQDAGAVIHRFLILELRRSGRKDIYLRLDRRREEGTSLSRFFRFSGRTKANDVAQIAGSKQRLLGTCQSENRQTFATLPTLGRLQHLLRVIVAELSVYSIWPENCWFFCSIIQEDLGKTHYGTFVSGELKYAKLGREMRLRIIENARSAESTTDSQDTPRLPTLGEDAETSPVSPTSGNPVGREQSDDDRWEIVSTAPPIDQSAKGTPPTSIISSHPATTTAPEGTAPVASATSPPTPRHREPASAARRSGAYAHPAALAYARAHPRRTIPRFGPYLLLQTIGQGNVAKVKLGLHLIYEETVAVKLIRRGSVEVQRVEQEIEALRIVRHPNIVRLYDVIETDKYIGIILTPASGGELFDHILAHRYLREPAAAKLFAQMISAVWYCHTKRIIHRDLKLENILLDHNQDVVIAGFGLANSFAVGADDMMQTACGSPCYAAPEVVISGATYAGSAADVWSCGVILYAMLAGYLPFDDDPENPDGDNIIRLYKYIISTPLKLPQHVSSEARDLLCSILVPEPQKRASLERIMDHPWLRKHRPWFQRSVEGLESDAQQKFSSRRLEREVTGERTLHSLSEPSQLPRPGVVSKTTMAHVDRSPNEARVPTNPAEDVQGNQPGGSEGHKQSDNAAVPQSLPPSGKDDVVRMSPRAHRRRLLSGPSGFSGLPAYIEHDGAYEEFAFGLRPVTFHLAREYDTNLKACMSAEGMPESLRKERALDIVTSANKAERRFIEDRLVRVSKEGLSGSRTVLESRLHRMDDAHRERIREIDQIFASRIQTHEPKRRASPDTDGRAPSFV